MTNKRVVPIQSSTNSHGKKNAFNILSSFFTIEISKSNIKRLLISHDEQELLKIVERNGHDSNRLDRMDMILYKILGDHNDDRITLGVRQLGNLIRKTVLDKRRECG